MSIYCNCEVIGEKIKRCISCFHLACIFGVDFCQISELPRLLSFVKVPFVGFLHLNHFNLDGPLCGNWKRKPSAQTFTLIHH